MLAENVTILKHSTAPAQRSKNYVFGVKRKIFESSFHTKKNQRIWSFVEKVMIKLVSKGQICQEYGNQRFQVML